MFKQIRNFSSTCRQLEAFWRSTINTNAPHFANPSFDPKSVLLLSTVSNLQSVTKDAIPLYTSNIQVIVAGVDTVKGSRDGLSELWLDRYIDIEGKEYLEDTHKNWKPTQSNFQLNFNDQRIEFPLANSLFGTGNLVTLFNLGPRPSANLHDILLKEITLNIPDLLSEFKVQREDRWVPLFDETMHVTKCVGNLVKGINNKSAAKFLETNDKLMSLKSKETEVYVKLTSEDGIENRFQVIAGGGGWGPKADTIALSPDAKVKKNDKIEFYMLTPEDKSKPLTVQAIDGLEFESSLPELGYPSSLGYPQLFNTFGCGSEAGFRFNNTNHKSPGERVSFII